MTRKPKPAGQRIGDRCPQCDGAFLIPRDRRMVSLRGDGEVAHCPACGCNWEVLYQRIVTRGAR